MRIKTNLRFAAAFAALLIFCAGCAHEKPATGHSRKTIIASSDTLLSSMISSLLPADKYTVETILPPGQCPGHYDVKLSDIEKLENADLVAFTEGLPFLKKAGKEFKNKLPVDAGGRNWMSPEAYEPALRQLAAELSKRFPDDEKTITRNLGKTIRDTGKAAGRLKEKLREAGLQGKPIIASSMQKEPLEWMGFKVVAEYGRPETMSSKEILALANTGRKNNIIMVVDNIQSGPEAGKGVAAALGAPHAAITNFPSEKGYLATLESNIETLINASKKRR